MPGNLPGRAVAVAPGELHGRRPRGAAAGGEIQGHLHAGGRGVRIDGRAFGLDGGGIFQSQGPEGQVHEVAGHVAEGAGAEVPPAAPFCGW